MKNLKHSKSKPVLRSIQEERIGDIKRAIYGLDARSVILFRFSLGILLFYNLLTYKFGSFQSVYAPQTGFLGNDFIQHLAPDKPLSWLKYLGQDYLMLTFFSVAAIAYLLLAFNVKPFYSSLLSYFCYSSISLRYFPVRAGWDYYIDVLLFLTVFLSFQDLRKYSDQEDKNENRNIFSFLVIFQIGIIYLFAAISKSGANWQNGTAVAYIIGDTTLNKPLGIWFLQHAPWTIIRILTYATLIWEYLLFFLLFLPYKNQKIRLWVSLSIILFHWTINLFADVGHFKYITSCAAIVLLPSFFWTNIFTRGAFFFNLLEHKRGQFSPPDLIVKSKYYKRVTTVVAYYFVIAILTSNIIFTLEARKIIPPNGEMVRSVRGIFPRKSYFFSQNWAMYSPNPMPELGVLKMEGLTLDGKIVNLINDLNNPADIFKKDFPSWKFENQLLTLFKAKIIQQKDEEVIKRWFQYYINRYTANVIHPPIKIAYLYLYSIDGTVFLKTRSCKINKTEVIKADISY